MLNQCVIIGRLTKDPDLNYVGAKATALCKFTVAVDRKFVRQGGERETDFFDVACFGKAAENVKQYTGKGRLVAVTGSMEIRKWKDKDEQWRSAVQLSADNVRFLDRAKEDAGDERPAKAQSSRSERPAAPHPATGQKDFGDKGSIGQEIDEEIDLDDDPF